LSRSWLFSVFLATAAWMAQPAFASPGDELPRIACPGYRAFIYAEGLSSPDGLAWGPDGAIFVAEESAHRVSLVQPDGSWSPVLTGCRSPEGVATDPQGRLLVVEDVENGRLLRQEPSGELTVLAQGLDAPEGVACLPDGTVYLTESNAQFAGSPFEFRTRLRRLPPGGQLQTVVESFWFWSYAGAIAASDGLIYFTNEAAGVGAPHAVLVFHPGQETVTVLATDMLAPEGLRFPHGGGFPLFVALEDSGSGEGRLARVAADGSWTLWAGGFGNIEDVLLSGSGEIFVSEDTTGLIVRLVPDEPPTHTPTASPSPVPPTPTPTHSRTPTPEVTVTRTPTRTPTEAPSATRTATATHSPTVTPTRTAVPSVTSTATGSPTSTPTTHSTRTPTPHPASPTTTATGEPAVTGTPTPAITPSGSPSVEIELRLADDDLSPGDEFALALMVWRQGAPLIVEQYVVLDVFGQYFFWPSWTQVPAGAQREWQQGSASEEILRFIWPPAAGAASGIGLWAGLIDLRQMTLVGNLAHVEFAYGE